MTKYYHRCTIPYTAVSKKDGEAEAKIEIIGFNDNIFVTTDCNGKNYCKLFKVKRYKTMDSDEALEHDLQKVINKILSWHKERMNGNDFYNHDIKTNRMMDGISLCSWLEMQFEAYLNDNSSMEDM